MRLVLDRLLPRERLVKIDLPKVRSASGAMQALSMILSAVTDGLITPSEGSQISQLARNYLELAMAQKLDERLSAIEARLGAAAPVETMQFGPTGWHWRNGSTPCQASHHKVASYYSSNLG
jgi:hypothetical protein